MKKLVASLVCLTMVFSMVACGSKKDDASTSANTSTNETPSSTEEVADDNDGLTDATLGGKLAIEFKNQIKNTDDIMAIAQTLSAENFSGYNCDVVEIQEGFLNGFTEEIKGFKRGVMFIPMINSIPFVGYIFETDDPEGMKATLLAKADPRWNICTEAAETVCITSGGYVFFTMCPAE